MTHQTLIASEEGHVLGTPGADWGSGGLELWSLNLLKGILVFKWKGAMGWASRGEQSYHPTEFLVARILRVERTEHGGNPAWKVTFEVDVHIGIKKKQLDADGWGRAFARLFQEGVAHRG